MPRRPPDRSVLKDSQSVLRGLRYILTEWSIPLTVCHWLGQIEAELDRDAEKSKMHFVSDCASYFCLGVIY